MKRERRKKLSKREWEQITSGEAGPVVRRIPKPLEEEKRLEEIAASQLDAHLEDEDTFRRWERNERGEA